MKLSLKIIRELGLTESFKRTDWDDSGFEYTLPSGIVLMGYTQLNNEPCEMDSLEGMDGYIYVETKEELEKLILMSYEETLQDIKSKNPEFDIDEYL